MLEETMLADLNERWRAITVGLDNLIYLTTDAYGKGRLLRLHPGIPGRNARVAKALFAMSDELDRRGGKEVPLDLPQNAFTQS